MRLLSGKFLIYCNGFVINSLNYYLHGKEILFFISFFQIKNQDKLLFFIFAFKYILHLHIFIISSFYFIALSIGKCHMMHTFGVGFTIKVINTDIFFLIQFIFFILDKTIK